jgi:hypothetical protein
MNPLFDEKQRFTQWWLYTGIVPVVVLEVIILSREASVWYDWWPILLSLAIFSLILLVSMRTVITTESVTVYYFPLLRKPRTFFWSDISKAYVRQYNPLSEYGGWGIKGLGGKYGKAYNVKGNHGLQLELKNGQKLLIGTQRMQELDQLLQNSFKHYTNN